ncbi:hypothetical protein D3C73_1599730 [compost metagenome]
MTLSRKSMKPCGVSAACFAYLATSAAFLPTLLMSMPVPGFTINMTAMPIAMANVVIISK